MGMVLAPRLRLLAFGWRELRRTLVGNQLREFAVFRVMVGTSGDRMYSERTATHFVG
jgi:hypothetical protein